MELQSKLKLILNVESVKKSYIFLRKKIVVTFVSYEICMSVCIVNALGEMLIISGLTSLIGFRRGRGRSRGRGRRRG
jgi:hypothetical protein